MANQGGMFVNGEKVDGRTLSFDREGIKVSNGEEEKVVVPNGGFDFAEDSNVDESEFKVYSAPTKKKIFDKNFLLGLGIGTVVGVASSYLVYKFMDKG